MERLHKMKECLICAAEEQVYGNLAAVDTEELGEVMDMIKDLSEAIYYCTITEAMEKENYEYPARYMAYPIDHRGDSHPVHPQKKKNLMHNSGGNVMHDGNKSYTTDPYYEPVYREGGLHEPYADMMRDPKEGRSGERRKMYMDGKGHKDKSKQMQELEAYMQELAADMTEMIQDASPEEKQLL